MLCIGKFCRHYTFERFRTKMQSASFWKQGKYIQYQAFILKPGISRYIKNSSSFVLCRLLFTDRYLSSVCATYPCRDSDRLHIAAHATTGCS